MAFCENCGKELAEGEVCTCRETIQEPAPQLAQPTVQPPVQQPIQPTVQPPEKKKGNSAVVVLIVFVVLILILAVVAVILLLNKDSDDKDDKKDKEEKSKKSSYMEPMDDFLKEFNDKNTDYTEVYAALMPDDAAELYLEVNKYLGKSDVYMDEYEYDVDYVEDCYDDLDDAYGEWEISFEKANATKLTGEDLDSMNAALADYYEDELEYLADGIRQILDYELDSTAESFEMETKDMEKTLQKWQDYLLYYEDAEITAAYEVTGKFILQTEDGTYESDEVLFCFAKINGSWTFFSNESGYFYFEDGESSLELLNDYLREIGFYVEIYF